MDINELSELNFGMAMEGKKPASMYIAEHFVTPYDDGIRMLQGGKVKEDLHKAISPRVLQKASEAVKALNGSAEIIDYPGELIKAYDSWQLGRACKKAGELLENNKSVDLLPIFGRLTSRVANQATGLTLAEHINYENYDPFIKCGYGPLDKIFGGIPTDGPIIIYGPTGVGKSFLASKISECLLLLYQQWTGGIYSLEMSAEHWMWRTVKMYPSMKDIRDRLYVSGSVRNIEELVAEVSIKKLNFVVIDDMDGLVSESSANEYERVYRKIKEMCRFLKIPVIVLAQPNRNAKMAGRFLGPYDIAWSGAAENCAALLIALQKVNELDFEEGENIFPVFPEDHQYLMIWKSREGWPQQQGPGAIILKPDEKLWSGKAVGNKLFIPGARRTLGKKTKRREE